MRFYRFIIVTLLMSALAHAGAAEPQSIDTASANPVVEERLKSLSHELRCLVCQNETLGDSRADLAIDLRNEIRALMEKGYSDKQVVTYLVARYGDFVRFRPPLKSTTVLLWFGPFILMVLGSSLLIVYLIRRRKRINAGPLSQGEQQRLRNLLTKLAGNRT
ncbi:MAG: cytochrome c-type biogenesis protein [Gammaproteobacteria bacterium]